jgi:hypothetical protein
MVYPKFKNKEECAYPERDICNYSDDGKIERCPYMKYDRTKNIFDSTRWHCIFNKNSLKSEHNQITSINTNKDNIRIIEKTRTNKQGINNNI